ncbi:hypothetical protein MBLNU459_g6509t1 [Dothideomycetes sp. NU459]
MIGLRFFVVFSHLLLSATTQADLVGIPTAPFSPSSNVTYPLTHVHSIVVDAHYANATDTAGSTLIPPTLWSFANTFAEDLAQHRAQPLHVSIGTNATLNSIFLTLGNSSEFVDAAGRPTNEAYTLDVKRSGIVITGSSPLGAWWGTRTLLQQFVLGDVALGTGSDAAGWGTRGVMLDAGRHYYPPDFITDMCSYLSFFKQNTFHLHLSDNLYNNVEIYSLERQLELYSAFRPWSEDPAVAGLNKRRNESYTRDEFEMMQQKCAARGVTIIPEIEAPGHALVITQWKRKLAIDSSIDLLNISYVDTIPVMETIWDTFLPWFHSKVVHIGADEYVDSTLTKDALVGEYTKFVNQMNNYLSKAADREVRIWGTFPPSSNATNVDTSVSVQHWEFFEANPYFDFIQHNYSVLNSDDGFYVVAKWSGSYPQSLNLTRVFHGDPATGGAFAPNIFDTKNATNNPSRDNSKVLGHVAALWNDYGPNATTYSEAYYSWRDGLPALADKQWGGALTEGEYARVFEVLHAAVPGQNLDRSIRSKSSTIVHYDFSSSGSGSYGTSWSPSTLVRDLSGNGYDAHTNCNSSRSGGDAGIVLSPKCAITTPLQSKGRNYTLSFSLFPTADTAGVVFSGRDSALLAGNGSSSSVMLVAAGNAFALNYTFPVGVWTHASLIARGNQTFLGVEGANRTGVTEMEFLTKVGINGERFVWAPIAVEAPVASFGGGAFEGMLKEVKLLDYA